MHLHACADKDRPTHMCTHLVQDSRPILDSSQAVVLNLLNPSWSYHLNASPAVIQKHREEVKESHCKAKK